LDLFAIDTSDSLVHNYWDGEWHHWESLGAGRFARDTPAVCSWAPGRLDVFVRNRGSGSTGITHVWYDNGWHEDGEDLGAATPSAPGACAWPGNRLHVFHRGTGDELWWRSYDDGWKPWEQIAADWTSGCAATAWADGRIDVFGRSPAGSVLHAWQENGRWYP
jgi:hypothetical protein